VLCSTMLTSRSYRLIFTWDMVYLRGSGLARIVA